MSKIVETAVWEPTVYQWDVDDPNKAGPALFDLNGEATDGFANAGVQQLSNRTAYLKETLDSHIGSRGTSHKVATTTEAGFMSVTDKSKLTGIEAGAQVNAVTSVASKTGAVTLVKVDVGLGNVDNTADTAKPVSTAQQTALNLKANLASPTFTGTPLAPTPTSGDNSKKIATTEFVAAAINGGGTVTSVAGKTGDVTLVKGDVGLGNVDNTSDANKPVSTAQQTALNLKANLASPALTGVPTAPTAVAGTNTTQIATTAFVLQNSIQSSTKYMHIQHQSPKNVSGGNSVTGGTAVRPLNTVVANTISGATLSNDSITLPPGTYVLNAVSSFRGADGARVSLWNTTDGNETLTGTSAYSTIATVHMSVFTNGMFSITAAKNFVLRYNVKAAMSGGLGTATDVVIIGSATQVEVYTDVQIWKLS